MDCLIGIKCKDCVMVAADTSYISSILVMKTDENKLYPMTGKLVMAISGKPTDTVRFADFISKNLQLYKVRRHYELGTEEACNFTRRTLADALRTRDYYRVNMLLAGYEETPSTTPATTTSLKEPTTSLTAGSSAAAAAPAAAGRPVLYFIDHLGAMTGLDHAAHGYGGLLTLSVMDRYHMTTEMDKDKGYELMKMCVKEVQGRLALSLPKFKVQCVGKDGVVEMPPITADSFKSQLI